MDHLALTLRLAAAAGAETNSTELAPLFAVPAFTTEWSFNQHDDARGRFRVSRWTGDSRAIEGMIATVAPQLGDTHARLGSHTLEGVGLAHRSGRKPSVRWWSQVEDNDRALERARTVWPESAAEIDALLAAGAGSLAAYGVDVDGDQVRTTVYTHLRSRRELDDALAHAGAAIREPVERMFAAPLCGGAWPKVWLGRGLRGDRAWKLYYFAHGDANRRTDEALLDLVDADVGTRAAWAELGKVTPGPRVQLLGFTAGDTPRWTVYLGQRD